MNIFSAGAVCAQRRFSNSWGHHDETSPPQIFLHLAAGAAALPVLPRVAFALDTIQRGRCTCSVALLLAALSDIVARLIGQRLSERLGQPFVIEDRPGAGSNLAAEDVVRAAPDGYTLLLMSAVNAWNTAIYDKLNFDFLRDITPVASIEQGGAIMEVNPAFPAKTVPDFIAYAKAHPGKIIMASAGPGSGPHLWGELFKVKAGVDLVTVQYRGSPQALPISWVDESTSCSTRSSRPSNKSGPAS